MSDENEIFDDFLKRKLDSKQFELKADYWLNARKLIDQNRRAFRGKFTSGIYTGLMILSATIGLVVTASIKVPTPEISSEAINTYSSSDSKSATSTNNSLLTDLDKSQAGNSNTASKTQKGITKKALRNINHTNITATVPSQISHITKDEQENVATNQVVSSQESLPNQNSSKTSPASSFVSAELADTEVPVNTLNKDNAGAELSEVKAITTPAPTITETESIPVAEEVTVINRENVDDVSFIDSRVFNMVSLIPVLDQIPSDTSLRKRDVYRREVDRRQQQRFMTAEAGVNYYNPSGTPADAINFHGGLKYYYFVQPRIVISAGLTYSRLQQNLDERVFRKITYAFGEISNNTTFKTLRLDYIELPLNVAYNVAGYHYLNAGVSFGYLLESSELIKTQGETVTSIRDNGHKQAITPFDIQLNLGYQVFLPKGFNCSVGYYYGLTDISKNSAFKSDMVNRNMGLRFTLGYRLF